MASRTPDVLAGSAGAVEWTPAASEPDVAVEAGTLLAVAGQGGHDAAGAGVVAVGRHDGRVELRAARDGRPLRGPEGVGVEPLHEIHGSVDRAVGDRDVRGALSVSGHVGAGRRVGATGTIRIDGMVDRAAVSAGGELVVEGRAGGAALEAGAVARMRRALHGALGAALDDLDEVLGVALQLLAAAALRGATVPAGRALATLCEQRHPDLPGRLDRAEAVLAAARRERPGLAPALALELGAARAILADPVDAPDPLARLRSARAFLVAATAARPPLDPPGMRLHSAHGTTAECAGALRVTGPGLTDCELVVGGDLIVAAPGAGVRGGHARVGGRLRAGELAGRQGAPLRIVMGDARPGEGRVRAAVVQPGVVIVVAGEAVRIERRLRDLRIDVEAGRPVVSEGW